MPRPKGSRNKPKDNAAPKAATVKAPRVPGIGDNSERITLTEDQKAALHFQHKKSYEAALAVQKKAAADFKNVCKIAKADLGKNAIDDIKDSILLDTPEGEVAMKDKMANRIQVMRWNNVAVGHMDDLFPVDRTPSVEKAGAAGKRAGLAGEACLPPHDASTAQGQEWLKQYHVGQAILAGGIKQKPADDDRDLRAPFMRDEGEENEGAYN